MFVWSLYCCRCCSLIPEVFPRYLRVPATGRADEVLHFSKCSRATCECTARDVTVACVCLSRRRHDGERDVHAAAGG